MGLGWLGLYGIGNWIAEHNTLHGLVCVAPQRRAGFGFMLYTLVLCAYGLDWIILLCLNYGAMTDGMACMAWHQMICTDREE